jgi:hypothetical protein
VGLCSSYYHESSVHYDSGYQPLKGKERHSTCLGVCTNPFMQNTQAGSIHQQGCWIQFVHFNEAVDTAGEVPHGFDVIDRKDRLSFQCELCRVLAQAYHTLLSCSAVSKD